MLDVSSSLREDLLREALRQRQLHRALEHVDRQIVGAALGQRFGQSQQALRIVRIEAHGFLQVLERFGDITLHQQHAAEIAVRERVVGPARQRVAKRLDRIVEAARLRERRAQVEVRRAPIPA